jgi:hypothetical protein
MDESCIHFIKKRFSLHPKSKRKEPIMRKSAILLLFLLIAAGATAQKTMYVPDEWKHPWNPDTLLYSENDPNNRYTWSKSRSLESDNVIVLWDKGYGSTLPSQSPTAYRVDEQDLLRKCEQFYDLEINKLGFVDKEKTNLRKYKVMVLLNHTTDWVCYGGGYDFEVSALWLGPSACKPVGHSVAHEVGHSFHYMCYADASGNNHNSSNSIGTGFHLPVGNGQAIWEQTAQWQAAQSYPNEMYNQSINVFRKSHNLAFSHEWHRYQSYWLHYYLCDKYDDITTVGQVWRQPMTGVSDFNNALMKLKGLDVEGLFRLYYDYAAHCASWDFRACIPYRRPYIGDFDYRCVQTADNTYQVALASTPQSTGFNIIPLQVPEAGTEIITHFTALPTGANLAEGDPAELMNGDTGWSKTTRTTYIRNTIPSQRAFRLGYVALMKDGTRQYIQQDALYCQTGQEVTEDVGMTVPEGVDRLWLIVVPAPKRYNQHKWDENMLNDEHWPYRFSLEGTDIDSRATVYVNSVIDGRQISDITFNYDIYFPTDAVNHSGTTFNVSGKALAQLGTAFQTDPSTFGGKMQGWGSAGPGKGKMMFYPLNPTTGNIVNRASTANGYGHWFNAKGAVCSYGEGYVYSEFVPSSMTFTIGQYPGRLKENDTYKIGQAICYRDANGKQVFARFWFTIHVTPDKVGAQLSSMEYEDPTGMKAITSNSQQASKGIFTLSGQEVETITHKGVYIIDGKKRVMR